MPNANPQIILFLRAMHLLHLYATAIYYFDKTRELFTDLLYGAI